MLTKTSKCCHCGADKALRPFGPNGAPVCYTCGTKPEHVEETRRQFTKSVLEWSSDASIAAEVEKHIKKVFK